MTFTLFLLVSAIAFLCFIAVLCKCISVLNEAGEAQ
jgi:hypothetical protein